MSNFEGLHVTTFSLREHRTLASIFAPNLPIRIAAPEDIYNMPNNRRKHPNLSAASKVALMVALSACNSADFKSESKKKVAPEAATLTCSVDSDSKNAKYTEEDLRVGVRGDKNARILVNGEFCPQAPARLNIVFLIDFSLSMYNENQDRGNDPIKNGSCGRLEAARAIINSHNQHMSDEDAEISVGVVQFASELAGTIALTPLADMNDQLTTKNFCRGINGTNYKAAFEEATSMLDGVNGTKVVYLISDGMPTEGGGGARENAPRHRDAAQKAADKMRKKLSLLTYNTVYLGNIHELEEDDFEPKAFLEQLTGSAERVKLVDKAENLANEILKLEKPEVDLDTAKVTSELTADGTAPVSIPLSLFKAHATKAGTWVFATEEFAVFPGSTQSSRLRLTAKDKNGETYQMSLKFEPGNETKPLE